MRPLVYDAGALIALDRGKKNTAFTALHTQATLAAINPAVPAAVVGQVYRDGARQARLSRFLNDPEQLVSIYPLDIEEAKAAGVLCGKAGTSDVVDASVVLLAARLGAIIVTSDPGDIAKLIEAMVPAPNVEIYTV